MEDNKPKRTVEEILAAGRKRTEEAKARIAAAASTVIGESSKPEQLPMWAEAARGVPNSLLRGALFGIGSERTAYVKRTIIATLDDYEIRYLGILLNQTDLDVWEMLLHIARLQPLGTKLEITAYSLLKALGRGTGKTQHEQLKEELARLGAGFVEITSKKLKKTFASNLISSFKQDEETGHLLITFNNEMKTLYESDYTMIDWDQRMALGRNNLAKWLHGHYSTHAKPYPYKVETLRELCRSSITRLGDFRKQLRAALDALKEVGAIDSWEIDINDLVHVTRTPSNSQRRHLAKKQPTRTNRPSSNTVLGHLSKPKR
jgi:TrfA protein